MTNYVTPHTKQNMRQWFATLDVNFLIRLVRATIKGAVCAIAGSAISFFRNFSCLEKKLYILDGGAFCCCWPSSTNRNSRSLADDLSTFFRFQVTFCGHWKKVMVYGIVIDWVVPCHEAMRFSQNTRDRRNPLGSTNPLGNTNPLGSTNP